MSDLTFSCTKCGTIEMHSMVDPGTTLCSECATGQWHGYFKQEEYNSNTSSPVSNVSSSDDPFEDELPSFS